MSMIKKIKKALADLDKDSPDISWHAKIVIEDYASVWLAALVEYYEAAEDIYKGDCIVPLKADEEDKARHRRQAARELLESK